jgi:hypothetical protein
MAWFDEYDTPNEWSNNEAALWDMSFGDTPIAHDQMAMALFDAALFNFDLNERERAEVLSAMRQYFDEQWDIDFDDTFDWEMYRAWYESA